MNPREIVERAARVTRERIAPRAAAIDREARNPVESWRDLWNEGLLAVAVPAAHGGLGADMPTYIAVIRTIAQGCASTAMTVHMHSTVMRFIEALATDAQQRHWYAEVVQHGRLFGSWGSEPAVSLSRTFLMETVVRAKPSASKGTYIRSVTVSSTMGPGIRIDPNLYRRVAAR